MVPSPSDVTCCRHADKVRWIWEGLHEPCVDCIIVCGPVASGKSAAVAEALRGAQTRGNSWHNEVLLWNYGDVPCRVPLPGRPTLPSFARDRHCDVLCTSATSEELIDRGARGLIVLRLDATGADDDDLVRALRKDLGEERCRMSRFVPDPDRITLRDD